MKLVNDFYNKFNTELNNTYFPNESRGTTENNDYWACKQITENFSNGCLSYISFLFKIAKRVQVDTHTIDLLASKYIISK